MKTKIVMISGKQGSGKSTLADSLQGLARECGYTPYRTRFAKVIYEMHDAVRDIGHKYGVAYPHKNGPLLQLLGTELGRNMFGEDVWVNALKKDIELSTSGDDKVLVIIDDMRFKNEFDAFTATADTQVYKIRLEASKETRKARCPAWRDNDTHPSETDLDDYSRGAAFDHLINADKFDQDTVLAIVLRNVFGENYRD